MRTLLRELRSLIEHEKAVYGDPLLLDADGTSEPPEASSDRTSAGTSVDGRSPEPASSKDVRSEESPSEDPPADTGSPSIDASSPETESDGIDSPPSDAAATDSGDTDSPASDPASNASSDPSNSPDAMPNQDLFGNEVDPAEDPSLPPWERITSLIPDDAPYKDAETLEEVESFLANNVLVPIDEDRENPVFGVGDPNADLVIIGEAPGRDEDKEGEPFVGRAGKLLDKILDAINFEREDVYITNILKSRPPRNRDPHAEEVEAHLPILYKQLALIRPEIILCVGKVAGNTMLDRSSSLSSLRDKEHDFYGIPVIVTYHPAALLRNPQWKRPTWEDVKLLRTRYDQLTEA